MEKVHTAVDAVIVLCGHGSRDPRFKMDFLKFAKSIELCFKSRKTYFCFIEKNNPSIEEMLDIKSSLSKLFFLFNKNFLLLVFDIFI